MPNIVDLAQFRYRERIPLRPHLVCTRGFSTYYSVDVVVRAFAEVRKEYPEAQLDLVGNGPLEGDIRKLVADLNLSGVNFTGVAPYREISKYYEQADIFINASWLDNMPLSVIEAFASGTPVVTTSPECMPYLVKHERTGLLSPVGDEKALAANVIRLLRDPARAARLAQNARDESQKLHLGSRARTMAEHLSRTNVMVRRFLCQWPHCGYHQRHCDSQRYFQKAMPRSNPRRESAVDEQNNTQRNGGKPVSAAETQEPRQHSAQENPDCVDQRTPTEVGSDRRAQQCSERCSD